MAARRKGCFGSICASNVVRGDIGGFEGSERNGAFLPPNL